MSKKTNKNKVKVTPDYYFGDSDYQVSMLEEHFGKVQAATVIQIQTNEDLTDEEKSKQSGEVKLEIMRMLSEAEKKLAKRLNKFYGYTSKYNVKGELVSNGGV